MESFDTTTFRAVPKEGEQALIEWEQRIHDGSRGDKRYMNRETVRLLLKAFRTDEQFVDAAMLAVLNPDATHEQLTTVYNGDPDSRTLGLNRDDHYILTESLTSRMVWRGVNHPADPTLLTALDGDLAALTGVDPEGRMADANLWAFRAFLAWLAGDVETAGRHAAAANVLDTGTSQMAALIIGLLKAGITVRGGETGRFDVTA